MKIHEEQRIIKLINAYFVNNENLKYKDSVDIFNDIVQENNIFITEIDQVEYLLRIIEEAKKLDDETLKNALSLEKTI